jgi:LysR family cyn operon transcriptional activator
VLLESGAPDTLVALARAGYGTAIVPSNTRIPRAGVRAVPLVHRDITIGVWVTIAWDPRRFHAPYAEHFVEELVAYSRREFPGRALSRRTPPPPRPKRLAPGLSP